MKRNATAVWKGGLKDGKGTMAVGSGVVKDVSYNFRQRFEDEPGTNPEELIGAAHAGCFSMALSGQLAERGMTPERIETRATVSMDVVDGKRTITSIHLDTTVKVQGDAARFQEAAEAAKNGCPISRLLAPGTEITLQARLG